MKRVQKSMYMMGIALSLSTGVFGAEWISDTIQKIADDHAHEVLFQAGKTVKDALFGDGQQHNQEKGWDTFTAQHEEKAAQDFLHKEVDHFLQQHNTPVVHGPSSIEVQYIHPHSHAPSRMLKQDVEHFSLPSFASDTQPIDYINGGMNAAKGARMRSSLYAIPEGEVYRYLVGLEAASPLLASATKQIQTWANQLNAMQIHSYESAAALVPGMWPKAHRASTYLCEHALITSKKASDWFDATYQCQNKETRAHVLKSIQNTPKFFAGQVNVAEKIGSLLHFDAPKIELLMNITGTVVVQKEGSLSYFPPLHREMIALLHTGKEIADGYKMGADGFSVERGFVQMTTVAEKEKVLRILQKMQTALRTNAPFSAEEKEFFATSSFPVGTFLTVMTQFKGNGASALLERASEMIALERTMQFVEEIVHAVLYKTRALLNMQISGYEINAYLEQVQEVLDDLKRLQETHDKKVFLEKQELLSLLHIEETMRKEAVVE